MHHTRQMIVDAIGESEYLTVRLGEGGTAYWPGSLGSEFHGPGLVTYRRDQVALWGDFDPLAGDHDPRCDLTSSEGDACRLLGGDHLAHYWGETDGDDR